MVDKSLLMRKLADLDTYAHQVGEFTSVTLHEYEENWKTQRIVERTLQMAIEVCVDIANHIIADSAFRIPTTYAESFQVLEENRIIDKKLQENLSRMCKFRNIVVHEYDKVDPAIVIAILRNNLNDFDVFKSSMIKILQGNKG